ncbi:MAG: carbonic anhydrase [Phyllobacteriaceae bacterium]|nr:carbonic anhydrase [Phyllobacteriaceae bacterium]
MCEDCTSGPTRRALVGWAGALAVAATSGFSATPAMAAGGPKTDLTADAALAKLKAGNARYVADAQVCASDLGGQRHHVAGGQAPWATILSCADSRVPPELLFGGLGLGELFVARNAGNLVDTATTGTIEYGAAVLGVPLIVVMGHQRCGAVAAACDVAVKNATFPGSIGEMIEPIVPAALAVKESGGDFVVAAAKENARRTAARLLERSTIVADLVRQGKVKVTAAYYELDSGKVEFLA